MAGDPCEELRMEGGMASLSPTKQRLLDQRMRGAGLPIEQGLRPRAPGTKIPLSAEQRRVWLHAQQQPDVPIYNEPVTVQKFGNFDLRLLEASFEQVLRRHEAWRTSFSPQGEQLVQPVVSVRFPLIDISGLPAAEREAEAVRIATEEARSAIAIGDFPLYRAKVVRMSPHEHRLYLTFHHIIFDGVSIERVFVPELSAIYASLEAGRPWLLAEPLIQYGDYAVWREQHAESPAVKRHLAWWLDQLSGELPTLRLPEDHVRPATANHRGSVERLRIPAALAERLRQFSRDQGVTLYMTLLAAFGVLLFRYSGQSDFIVGSATDARRRPELEKVMGYFLDTFALRTRPTADLAFAQYLSHMRESVLGGVAAADVPFDRVVQEIRPKRDTGRHPIFQVFFTMLPLTPPLSEDWKTAPTDVTVGASKFDLHLEVGNGAGGLDARFFYRTDLWDAPTIRRMAAQWLVLLESIERNPDTPLGLLGMLTAEEISLVAGPRGWNDTARPLPEATLPELIEDQVRRTPKNIAVAFGNERWSYEALNARAEAIAAMLCGAGVTRGSVVAIALDRSLDMLAGLVAVLKTGAAYLPLDIHMPRERVEQCLADAEPSAILTQRSLVQRFEATGRAVVLVDGHRDLENLAAVDRSAKGSTRSTGDLDDTAYLIYTSGTTGEPKAVEITQRSLVNLMTAMQTEPGFGPEDVLLAVTPISFDIAALELFLPLICGGIVVIAAREEVLDPYLLASAISRSGCTVMQATPATWRALLLSGWRGSSRRLRVLCGGEALPGELASRLLATGAELWNMYGPTETTIWSLIHRVHPGTGSGGEEKETGRVSVGRPIANTTAFLLDAQQQLLPIGVPGELFLGGVGLARGYRGRAKQTAERFFTVESAGGLRLYRTGDIAVRRADGTIEVLGRTDNQVKVRGHRIELEAVEAAVLRHPRVAAAAAGAWPEATGDLRLSVYVVAAKGAAAPDVADMREFLGRSLPESMIPSDVVALPEIPLTPHGKVDRARLPRPMAKESVPLPSKLHSSEEVRLAAIWADLLGRNHIGREDNFFDLGGHSLLVAALQQRIANSFGRRIPIIELFQNPTIRQQSELTRGHVRDVQMLPPGVHALQPKGMRNSIFWAHHLGLNLAKEMGDDQPFISVGLTAEDVTMLGEAPTLQRIAGCLLDKILATQAESPYTIGGLCLGGVLAYEIASQLQDSGREVSLLVLLDPPNPSYLDSCDSVAPKFSYLRYILKRAAKLGPRVSLKYFREHLFKLLPRSMRLDLIRTEVAIAREMIETAAFEYQPRKYEGKVLLMLASERPPHVDFLPGWQAVVPRSLHTHYVDGHHRDLIRAPHVKGVAGAILSHLKPAGEES
jgi:amino acid adenylation domain-containing protein